MKIAIGSDHRGFRLKGALKRVLTNAGHVVVDAGTENEKRADYPDYAFRVAEAVSRGRAKRGILICATGIGMCIAANRLPKVRAALCGDARTARMSRAHNDANVLCLSADAVSPTAAARLLRVWLRTRFTGGRHRRRLLKLERYARDFCS